MLTLPTSPSSYALCSESPFCRDSLLEVRILAHYIFIRSFARCRYNVDKQKKEGFLRFWVVFVFQIVHGIDRICERQIVALNGA